MELELAGKRTLVTGSSGGIGRAIAATLQAEGCHVALNGRDSARLHETARELGCAATVVGDVTDPEQARRIVANVVEQLGGLDVLVCNVGSGRSVPPGRESADEWQRIFALNLWSATNMVEAARQALAKSRGVIVCISSICGAEVILGAPVTYSAAKAALHAYVRGIARPLGLEGVRINAIAPGNILFDSSVWAKKIADDASGVKQMLMREVSLARLGAPEEIADAVAYMVSARAGFASGAVWTLDGGQTRA
jgi:3-oxoacyl-[acyl-carrier protein] reductase